MILRLIKLALKLGVLGAAAGVLLGLFGQLHPAFDTIAHSRFHFGVCLMIGAIGAIVFRAKEYAVISLLFGFLGLFLSYNGTILAKPNVSVAAGKPVHTALHFNLLFNNERQSEFLKAAIAADPVFISVTEAGPLWDQSLRTFSDKWPHLFHCPEFGKRGGIKIFSKWRFEPGKSECGVFGSLAKVSVVAPDNKPMDLILVHSRWPWPASGPKQLDANLPILKKTAKDALATGDFNATTWSYALQKFATASGMNITPGIGPTWILDEPVINSWFWAGLPIDNVLSKGRVRVISAETLAPMGSDHLPIKVKFQIAE